MKRILVAGLVAVALLAVFATRARSTIGPPVDVTLLGEPRAAKAGEPFAGELRVTAQEAGRVGGFLLDGKGWDCIAPAAPAEIALRAGEATVLAFTATPEDPGQWLVLRFTWNGTPVEKHLDLSERAARLATTPIPAAASPPGVVRLPVDGIRPRAEVKPAADAVARPPEERLRRTIRVRGEFRYERPDNVLIGVDGLTVEIWDSDPGLDDHVATTVTNAFGRFDHTFDFHDDWEEYPDLYLKFRSENAEHEVKHATWGYVFEWETGVWADVSAELNTGPLHSADDGVLPALHILTNVSRSWRFWNDLGYDTRFLEVEWPDGDEGAWYVIISEEIHVSTEQEWFDPTACHEYGHHWINCFADAVYPDYCNDYCDASIVDCGHCSWCPENDHDAWSEGFCGWCGHVIPGTFDAEYGEGPYQTRRYNDLDVCGEDSLYHGPTVTEGYVAAALVDIYDSSEDAHAHFPGHLDRLNLGPEEIADCVDDIAPHTMMGFLNEMMVRYPADVEDLWDTAANCGFELDEEPPGAPPSVWSSTHSTSIPSPDATITVHWTRPTDDASGANAYSVLFSRDAPALPNTTVEVEDSLRYTSVDLPPGNWYACVRARDRAGTWSPSYRSIGPYVIREPHPADLDFTKPAGWDYPVVPTSVNTSGPGGAVVSATLPGRGTTYYNVAGINDGESATESGFDGEFLIDGAYAAHDSWAPVGSDDTFFANNQSVSSIGGGRHTASYFVDSDEVLAEPTETDNTWGHQFVWTPYHLTAGTVFTDGAPRHALGGWETVRDGSPLYWNCRGLRFDNEEWWNAVVVWPTYLNENPDVRLHLASTGAQNGFTVPLDTSTRNAGCLDAVLVNRGSVATAEYDVGVVWYGSGIVHPYKAVHVVNDYCALGSPVTTTLGPDHWLEIYEFEVSAADTGMISVMVETDPPFSPVYVQWREEEFVLGGLLDCQAQTTTGEDGTAHLVFTVPEAGFNSVTIFRDPRDGESPVEVTFEVMRTPADFLPVLAAGWHSPMVPRPAADGAPASVPLPDTLRGNVNATYYNLALTNDSPRDVDSLEVYVLLDGSPNLLLMYLSFPGYATSRLNWPSAVTVRGGRHTLAQFDDPLGQETEISEVNNVYGEQYCWSPYGLGPGGRTTRVMPPGRTAGWGMVLSGEPLHYNCDGLRMVATSGWWGAIAVMPGVGSDVDVRLHERLGGVKNGFGTSLTYSGWGKEALDYVLVNYNATPRRDLDVGVLNVQGSANYFAHYQREAYLATPEGMHGPYIMQPNYLLHLFEMVLTPGSWGFMLEHLSGNVDWGMTLHAADQAFANKSTGLGSAWMNGIGGGESFVADVPAAGYYCLAVWKAKTSDVPVNGEYQLRVLANVTAVEPGAAPEVTRLLGADPNPLRSATAIAFDLAEPGPVTLTVFDLRGRAVRELVREERPAGAQVAAWDGRDDAGRPVAAGLYLAHFVAGGVRGTAKITVLR